MKPKFSTRILAMVLMLALIVPTLVFNISAEEEATLSFADKAQRTSYSTTAQVWEQNGITFTNNKSSSTTNVADYAKPVRLYAKSEVIVECALGNITQIVFDCNSSSYATALKNSIGDAATASSDKVTVTLDGSTNSFTVAQLTAQVRMDSLTVTYATAGSDEPAEPSISIAGDSVVLVDGDPITLTATPKNIEGNVVWTVDDETVATVADGVVTGLKMGTVTVTASIGEVFDEKKVAVLPAAESKITIAEANEIAKAVGEEGTPCIYTVEGTVESIDTAWSEQYNNITVTVADETGSILAFRMKGGETLAVGQRIVVSGKLKDYSGTCEFDQPDYELVLDDTMEALLEALNALELKMSLAYKYTATVEEVEISGTVTDTLNNAFTVNSTATTYSNWSGKAGASGAVYAGNSAGGNSAIQLRSNNSNSGIVTTTSSGNVRKIVVFWNSNTTNGRTLDIYGSNTEFTSPTQLYNISSDGITKIGSLKMGESTELVVDGDYAYIGIRSASGALYLDSIEIEWDSGAESGETTEQVVYTDSNFAFRFAVDAALVELDGIDACGIKITAGGKSVFFEADAGSWTKVLDDETGDELYCITVELGDIMNDPAKLGTEFTMQAYVEVDGVKYAADTEKAYSVATMVAYYYETLGIEQVEHLYEYLSTNQLI
ncbi:MAG: Ig-like domain-containing protein [Clostridia bacterium]|nr:Ig-like domain-containing protein [Clostridia bacterium]